MKRNILYFNISCMGARAGAPPLMDTSDNLNETFFYLYKYTYTLFPISKCIIQNSMKRVLAVVLIPRQHMFHSQISKRLFFPVRNLLSNFFNFQAVFFFLSLFSPFSVCKRLCISVPTHWNQETKKKESTVPINSLMVKNYSIKVNIALGLRKGCVTLTSCTLRKLKGKCVITFFVLSNLSPQNWTIWNWLPRYISQHTFFSW